MQVHFGLNPAFKPTVKQHKPAPQPQFSGNDAEPERRSGISRRHVLGGLGAATAGLLLVACGSETKNGGADGYVRKPAPSLTDAEKARLEAETRHMDAAQVEATQDAQALHQKQLQALRKDYGQGITGWAALIAAAQFEDVAACSYPGTVGVCDNSLDDFYKFTIGPTFDEKHKEILQQALEHLAKLDLLHGIEYQPEYIKLSRAGKEFIGSLPYNKVPEPMSPKQLAQRKDISKFLEKTLPNGQTGRELLLELARTASDKGEPTGYSFWNIPINGDLCTLMLPYPEGLGLLKHEPWVTPQFLHNEYENVAAHFAPSYALSEDGWQVVKQILAEDEQAAAQNAELADYVAHQQ